MRNLTFLENQTSGGSAFKNFVEKHTGQKLSPLNHLLRHNYVDDISESEEINLVEKLKELSKENPSIEFSLMAEYRYGYRFYNEDDRSENRYLTVNVDEFFRENDNVPRAVIYKISDGKVRTFLPHVEFKEFKKEV